jgi:hypothetical protein
VVRGRPSRRATRQIKEIASSFDRSRSQGLLMLSTPCFSWQCCTEKHHASMLRLTVAGHAAETMTRRAVRGFVACLGLDPEATELRRLGKKSVAASSPHLPRHANRTHRSIVRSKPTNDHCGFQAPEAQRVAPHLIQSAERTHQLLGRSSVSRVACGADAALLAQIIRYSCKETAIATQRP